MKLIIWRAIVRFILLCFTVKQFYIPLAVYIVCYSENNNFYAVVHHYMVPSIDANP